MVGAFVLNRALMDVPAHILKAQLDAAYRALDTMGRDRRRWRARAESASAEAQGLRAAYDALVEPFTEATIRASELQARRNELAASEAQSRAYYQVIAQMRGSWSWRVTRPLRGLGRVARFVAERPRRAVRRFGIATLDGLAQAATWWRFRFGRPRTMWGVTPILTLPLLARCDRLLGLRSDSLVYTTYHVTSSFDINLKAFWERLSARHPRWVGPLHKMILRLALIRYDAFHLFADRGLMPPRTRTGIDEQEMKAIRQLGRRLYTYAYGADVRTRETTLALGRYNLCAECPEPMKYCICSEAEGAANVARIRGLATAMVTMGDMQAYAPGARNFHYWPIDTDKLRYVGVDWSNDRALRVAHAPNHTHFKGTKYLMAAIERLRLEGRAIELVRTQGVPNSEVMKLFESCDLVADQFIAGFHGYTALEAMALGKPVLCYLRDPSMAIDPAVCPMINAWPDTLYDVLRDCLDGRYDLAALGRRSRAYVEHYYSLEAVALRLGQMYLDTAGFGDRINRRITGRMQSLAAQLPPPIAAPPPIPWEAAPKSLAGLSAPRESVASRTSFADGRPVSAVAELMASRQP